MAKSTSRAKKGIKWSGALYRTVLDWAEKCRQEISALRESNSGANDEAAGDELENQQYDRLLQNLRQDTAGDAYQPESRADIEELLEKISAKLVEVPPDRHDLREHGMMLIDPAALPKYAKDRFSKQELEQWRVSKKSYRRKRERKPENHDRTGNARPQHDILKPTLSAEQEADLQRNLWPDGNDVEQNMREIVDAVRRAVQGVLSNAKIDGSQPVLVPYDSIGPVLRLLVNHVVGGQEDELPRRYREIQESQVRQRLPLEVFIRSLVGAAVTSWTLQTLPGLPEPFEGMCESMYRQARDISPVLATYLRKSALNHHLKQIEGESTNERACVLAGDLDNIMLPFFIGPTSVKNTEIDTVESIEQRDAPTPAVQFQSTGNLTGLNPSPPEWRLRWNKDLQGIFRQAIRTRIQMAKSIATYLIFTPPSGALVRTTGMRSVGGVETEASAQAPRVFVAFSPTIKAWVLDNFEDTLEGKESSVLSRAAIYTFDP